MVTIPHFLSIFNNAILLVDLNINQEMAVALNEYLIRTSQQEKDDKKVPLLEQRTVD